MSEHELYMIGFDDGRREAIEAIKAEPEYPGDLPEELQQLLLHALVERDCGVLANAFRLSVKLTKEGILNRLQESHE